MHIGVWPCISMDNMEELYGNLSKAISSVDHKSLRELLNQAPPRDREALGDEKKTLLNEAALNGNFRTMRLLIKAGVTKWNTSEEGNKVFIKLAEDSRVRNQMGKL